MYIYCIYKKKKRLYGSKFRAKIFKHYLMFFIIDQEGIEPSF